MQAFIRANFGYTARYPRTGYINSLPMARSFAFRGAPIHTSVARASAPQYFPKVAGTSPHIARWAGAGALGAVGLGLHLSLQPKVNCEPSPPAAKKVQDVPVATTPAPPVENTSDPSPPPSHPGSQVNVYELSFGTVCGVCAGVFVKKGAKIVAFALGGIFVLLQYLASINVITVNWTKVGSRFEQRFHSPAATTPGGKSKPPTVTALWGWLVDFLTADFQPRATFLAGFLLGLRLG